MALKSSFVRMYTFNQERSCYEEEIAMFLWIVAVLCAFFVKGLCGFANTLVFSTILSFGSNHINITPVELLLGYPANLVITWKERKNINWRICVPLAMLVLLGNIPGIALLKYTDAGLIKLLFGVVIIIVGCEMLLREISQKKSKPSKILLALIGILSGVLCGLFGIGALLAAYIGRVTDDSKAFKANICTVFIVENTFRIVLYGVMGILTWEILCRVAMLIPFMLIGLFAGMRSGRLLNEKIVKKIVIIMLIISGVALIVNNMKFL